MKKFQVFNYRRNFFFFFGHKLLRISRKCQCQVWVVQNEAAFPSPSWLERTECREKMSWVNPKLGCIPLLTELKALNSQHPPHATRPQTHRGWRSVSGKSGGSCRRPTAPQIILTPEFFFFFGSSSLSSMGVPLLLRNFLLAAGCFGFIGNWLHTLDGCPVSLVFRAAWLHSCPAYSQAVSDLQPVTVKNPVSGPGCC